MESNVYTGSNEALTWGDFEFLVFPNHKLKVFPNHPNPYCSLFGIIVDIGNLKGMREDKGCEKSFFLWAKLSRNCALCPVTTFGVIVEEDKIFQGIETI
jgi:hypothetical protein